MSSSHRSDRPARGEQHSRRPRRSLRFAFLSGALLWPCAAASQTPTFTRDVAPIVWTRCATCHRPGEIGPFSLITYDDVRRRASQIAAVTARRIMPPWKPLPGKGEFQNERRLSDREIDILQ